MAEKCKAVLASGAATYYHLPENLIGQFVERPGCELKKNQTNSAKPEVYKKIKEKLQLDGLHVIDGFNLFGGTEGGHDEYFCDGLHLNSAGSALLGVEVYKALRKAKVIPENYK